MLHIAPHLLAEAHQLRPLASPDGEVLIRFDGRKRDGQDPEIFAVIPVAGLAQAPTRLLAKLETLVADPNDDEAPQFRQTHAGPSLYLPMERDETEAFLAEFRDAVPSKPVTADLRILFGADGMGNFSRNAAYESAGNDFAVIDADTALDTLLAERSRQIRASIGVVTKDPKNDDDGPSLS